VSFDFLGFTFPARAARGKKFIPFLFAAGQDALATMSAQVAAGGCARGGLAALWAAPPGTSIPSCEARCSTRDVLPLRAAASFGRINVYLMAGSARKTSSWHPSLNSGQLGTRVTTQYIRLLAPLSLGALFLVDMMTGAVRCGRLTSTDVWEPGFFGRPDTQRGHWPIPKLINLYRRGSVKLGELITDRYTLGDINIA
jgi:hypothetical protein